MSDPRVLPPWLDAGGAVLDSAAAPAATLADSLPGLSSSPGDGAAAAAATGQAVRARRVRPGGRTRLSCLASVPARPRTVGARDRCHRVRHAGSGKRHRARPARRGCLAEGVLIAAGLRDSRTVELRLPAELAGHEAAFLNAVDALRSLAHVDGAPRIHLEVHRDSQASCWGEGRPDDEPRLVHTPETWCRLALLFADAARPGRRRC